MSRADRQSWRLDPTARASSSLASLSLEDVLHRTAVIEVGSRRWVAGVGEQSMPLCEVETAEELWEYAIKSEDQLAQWRTRVWAMLNRVLRRELLISRARDFTVVVLADTLFPAPLKRLLTDVLIRDFQVERVLFQPSTVCTVIGAAVRAALVVDLGWQRTTVTPVYELREMAPLAATSARCMRELAVDGMPDADLAAKYYLDETRDDDDELSVPRLLSTVLSRLSPDAKAALLGHIIFVGAGSRVDGLKPRILQAIHHQNPRAGAITTLDAWPGAIVWLQEAAWYRRGARIPGEIHRDRYLDGSVYLDDTRIAV